MLQTNYVRPTAQNLNSGYDLVHCWTFQWIECPTFPQKGPGFLAHFIWLLEVSLLKYALETLRIYSWIELQRRCPVIHLERVDIRWAKRRGIATYDIHRAREGVDVLRHPTTLPLERLWRSVEPCRRTWNIVCTDDRTHQRLHSNIRDTRSPIFSDEDVVL